MIKKICFIVCLLFCWTPSCGWKGPMNQGSVFHPFVCPSDSFLGIASLVFSETLHGIRGPCSDVHARAGQYLKNLHQAKMTKNGQKQPEIFGLFRKIKSLVLSGNAVKPKFLWSINILQKLHAREKSGFQVMVKIALFKSDFSIF